MAARYHRNTAILAKIEATYGTDATPTEAANALLVSNVSINPLNAQNVSRDLIRPFLGGSEQQPETIGQAALDGNDPLASETLRLWLECYGAFAGDLAMHWLARGGVYLAGGLAAKLLPHVDTQPFIDAFLAKPSAATLGKPRDSSSARTLAPSSICSARTLSKP